MIKLQKYSVLLVWKSLKIIFERVSIHVKDKESIKEQEYSELLVMYSTINCTLDFGVIKFVPYQYFVNYTSSFYCCIIWRAHLLLFALYGGTINEDKVDLCYNYYMIK